ncbi:MAG: hypothetical protein AB1758_06160 [Candidatus Eremiobacterota bacterium]
MRRPGFTLIEIILYSFLFVLGLMVVWSLFMMARRTQTSSFSSYVVGGNTETAFIMLRRDFRQTALSSIDAYPNALSASEPPGATMAGAVDQTIQVNPYGVPRWDRHVGYTLVGKPGQQTGQLVRWEEAIATPDFLPKLSPFKPSSQAGKVRTVLHNVLMPNTKVQGLGGAPNYASDQYGGFRVQFVRRDGGPAGAETLSSQNPSLSTDHASHTRLVEIELKILQKSGFGKADFYCMKIRVLPAY